jgi:hypothetical protein
VRFLLLQVVVFLTAGREGKRRRRRSRSTSLLVFAGGGAWTHAPPLFRRHQGCVALFPRISLCFCCNFQMMCIFRYYCIWFILNFCYLFYM